MFSKRRQFVPSYKKKIRVEVNEENFPSLAPNSQESENIEIKKPILDFKSFSFINNNDEEDEDNKIDDGWVCISYDKEKHCIKYEGAEITKYKDYVRERTTQEICDEMYNEWELYKQEYIETFGYEEYYKMFMPECLNYDLIYDYEEDADSDSENVDYLSDEYLDD